MYGCTNTTHGIAEVEYKRIRTDFGDILTYLQDGRNNPKRMKKTTRSTILTKNLAEPILQWNSPILFPQFKTISHLNGDDAEVGSF